MESELEALYDAYFKELEKYAHYQKQILEQDDNDDDEEEDDEEDEENEDDDEEGEEDEDTDNELVDNFQISFKKDMSDKNVRKGGQKLLSITHKFAEKKKLREEEAADEEESEEDEDDETSDVRLVAFKNNEIDKDVCRESVNQTQKENKMP